MSREDLLENETDDASPERELAEERSSTRINPHARRAIEDYQERRRLRELLGEDIFDF